MPDLTLTREQVEMAAYKADLEPERAVRTDYSGRAMYGDSCFGLVHDTPGELIRFVFELEEELQLSGRDDRWSDLMDFRYEMSRDVRQDSMGLSGITYWPHVRISDAS